jgi:hypothetical protein
MKPRKKNSAARSKTTKKSIAQTSRSKPPTATTLEEYLVIPPQQKNGPAPTRVSVSMDTLPQDYPILRTAFQSPPYLNAVSMTSVSQASQSTQLTPALKPLDSYAETLVLPSLHTSARYEQVNDNVLLPENILLKSFSEVQRTEGDEGDQHLLQVYSLPINLCQPVSARSRLPGYSISHAWPMTLEQEATNDLRQVKTNAPATQVNFFDEHAHAPIFNRRLELESFSPHLVDTAYQGNKIASPKLVDQETVRAYGYRSKVEKKGQQKKFQEVKASPPRTVVRTKVLWIPPQPDYSLTAKDDAKKIDTHLYKLSEFNPVFSGRDGHTIEQYGQRNGGDELLLSVKSKPASSFQKRTFFLEKSAQDILQKESVHRENKRVTQNFSNPALPFKKRKWLWRSRSKEDLRTMAENESVFVRNKLDMASTSIYFPEQAFFKSNLSIINSIDSDEEAVNINPLEIDFDRSETP